MFSIGILGLADVNVQGHYMQAPQYLGIVTMIAGVALGVIGLKSER